MKHNEDKRITNSESWDELRNTYNEIKEVEEELELVVKNTRNEIEHIVLLIPHNIR